MDADAPDFFKLVFDIIETTPERLTELACPAGNRRGQALRGGRLTLVELAEKLLEIPAPTITETIAAELTEGNLIEEPIDVLRPDPALPCGARCRRAANDAAPWGTPLGADRSRESDPLGRGPNEARSIRLATRGGGRRREQNRGGLGARSLNVELQNRLNAQSEPKVERFGWRFAPRDKVIQTVNNYDREVFNGDIGTVSEVDTEEGAVLVQFEAGRCPTSSASSMNYR